MTKDSVNWDAVNWTEAEVYEFGEVFKSILMYSDAPVSSVNFSAVYERWCYLLRRFPLPPVQISDRRILRARRNFNGEIFAEQHEISYNTTCPERLSLGRFNRPGEALFYGSLPTISDKVDFFLTAACEACKDFFDHTSSEDVFDLTFGAWGVKKFTAICLCLEKKHLAANERMKEYIEYFTQKLRENCNAASYNFIINTLESISNLSAIKDKNEGTYFVLTAFFCAIREVYKNDKEQINGIVYPSAETHGNGLNVVLTPNAVDTYLRLEEVLMYRVSRVGENRKTLDIFPVTDIVPVVDRKFQFVEINDKRNLREDLVLNSISM